MSERTHTAIREPLGAFACLLNLLDECPVLQNAAHDRHCHLLAGGVLQEVHHLRHGCKVDASEMGTP